ncbi:MAG: hypothetical protein ACQEQO_12740 [Thermodesulfobacteriota bacterium]
MPETLVSLLGEDISGLSALLISPLKEIQPEDLEEWQKQDPSHIRVYGTYMIHKELPSGSPFALYRFFS